MKCAEYLAVFCRIGIAGKTLKSFMFIFFLFILDVFSDTSRENVNRKCNIKVKYTET